jgi:hypothetical protein
MSIEHVVFLRLKNMSETEWQSLHARFMGLKAIDGVLELSFGPNFSPDRAGGAI